MRSENSVPGTAAAATAPTGHTAPTGAGDPHPPTAAEALAAELRESQERLQLAIEAADLGTWDLDLTTDTAPVRSKRHDEMFGYQDLQPAWGQAIAERHVLEEDIPVFRAAFARARQTGLLSCEVRVHWPDGSVHWIAPRGRTSYDAAGRPVRMAGVVADITERKRTEAALREAEERLRLGQALAGVGVFDWDVPSGRVIISDELKRLYGTGPEGYGGVYDGWRRFLPPEDLAATEQAIATATAQRAPRIALAFRIRRPDGALRHIEGLAAITYDPAGQPRRILGFNIDVTERIAAREALGASEERLRLAVEGTGLTTWDLDVPTGSAVWSPGHFAALGYPPAPHGQASLALWQARIAPEDRPAFDDALASCRDGRVFRVLYCIRRADDGAERWMETVGRGLDPAVDGRPRRILGIMLDVTERQQREAELRQGQKLQALGQLAGGVAHDFNNVLQAVAGSARLIRRRLRDPEAVDRYTGMILTAAERGAAITRRLLVLARRGELQPQAVDPSALLQGLREMLAPALGPAIAIRVEAAPRLPPLLADKAQLETALINLATNARDAMPEGGTLTLSAAEERAPAAGSTGGSIRLTVRDSGTGMDLATLGRALEPFFSTKSAGEGTGLGLPMAKGFAEQSGGRLAIASQLGQGTTVTLWLPQATATPQHEAAAHDAPRPRDQSRVLMVDDEMPVRETVSAELEAAGYTVHTASSGAEALERLAHDPPPDALLSDLTMPGMDGMALIRAARALRPELPAVLLTGFAGDAVALLGSGVPEGPLAFLRKPASGEQIAAAVAGVLQQAAHPEAAGTQPGSSTIAGPGPG